MCSILLELGVDDNPIWVWLLSRYDYLKNKINRTFERLRVEVESMRRKVAQLPAQSNATIAMHLRSAFRRLPTEKQAGVDTPEIIALWEFLHTSLYTILSPQSGILAEIVTFWETASNFIEGKTQATLPVGIDDQSRKHHRLSEDGARHLRAGGFELVTLLRDHMVVLFQDPPIDDISSMYSPLPPDTPNTPQTANSDRSISEVAGMPRPKRAASTAKPQDPGDEYAFLPPGANSLGGVHYLGKILTLLGNAASALSELPMDSGMLEKLKTMIVVARERCVYAVCIGWQRDAGNCKVLEDWTRSPENKDVTKMPQQFLQLENAVISGLQKLLYLTEVKAKVNSGVLPPPSTKLLTHVRGQFTRSLYKALQAMLDNAKRPIPTEEWDAEREGLASPVANVVPRNLKSGVVDQSDKVIVLLHNCEIHSNVLKNVRVLLTLSNLHLLKSDLVPQLITQFENAFSIQLTEESKTVHNVLGQLDGQLFDEYTRPHVTHLTNLITTSILSPAWLGPPSNNPMPSGVRPYVHASLLHLVQVHAEIATTSPALIPRIITFLTEKISLSLNEAFARRVAEHPHPAFSLTGLLQATLDVEMVNQTLSAYMTPTAQELQQNVYKNLDKGSLEEARKTLQQELGGVKAVLQRERKATRSEL